MLRHTVGAGALRAFAEQQRERFLTARSAHPAHAEDVNAVRPNEFLPQQRQQGQENARGVTPWRSDQLRPANLIPIHLRQPINRARQQIRPRVHGIVKFLVNFPIPQPEVRTEIDHHHASRQQGLGVFNRHAMRHGQECHFRPGRDHRGHIRRHEFLLRSRARLPIPRKHLPQ